MTDTALTRRPAQEMTETVINSDLLRRYLDYMDVSASTERTYTRQVRAHVQWLADHGISHPTRQDFMAWRDDLQARGLRPTTVQTYMASVRLFYKWLESEGIYQDITKDVRHPKVSTEPHRDYLTAGQISDTLTAIDRSTVAGLRDYAIILLAAECGLRTVELSRARVEDLSSHGGECVLYVWGKDRDDRSDYVIVPRRAEQAVRAYLASRGRASAADPLFTTTGNRGRGEPLTTRSISRIIKTRMQAVGIDSDRLTAHSLRHSFVMLAIDSGERIQDVQQGARHLNLATTQRYYHEREMTKNSCSRSVDREIFEGGNSDAGL